MNEPLTTRSDTDLEKVEQAIDRAGLSLGWKIRTVRPGRSMGVFSRGPHLAQVMIDYGSNSFSISYIRSTNLDAADGKIHKVYNRWVEQLSAAIVVEAGGIL